MQQTPNNYQFESTTFTYQLVYPGRPGSMCGNLAIILLFTHPDL